MNRRAIASLLLVRQVGPDANHIFIPYFTYS
jgi:hypothetical protein